LEVNDKYFLFSEVLKVILISGLQDQYFY
jgi:hypothetical protein